MGSGLRLTLEETIGFYWDVSLSENYTNIEEIPGNLLLIIISQW